MTAPGTSPTTKRPTRLRTLLTAGITVLVIAPVTVATTAHLTTWETAHQLPGIPDPIDFTSSATPDPGYDPARWNSTSVATTRFKLYRYLGVGRPEYTPEGSADNADTATTAAAVATHHATGATIRTGLPIWDADTTTTTDSSSSTPVLPNAGPGVPLQSFAASAGLRNGDVLLQVGTTSTGTFEQFLVAFRATRGTPVPVTYVRAGTVRTTTGLFPSKAARAAHPGVDLFGFAVAREPVAVLTTGTAPVTPRDHGGSGNSAGLMTTLAYLDALTPGDLSGGHRISGTGTMNPDGTAAEAGMDVFFVPAGANAADANAAAAAAGAHIPVVPVATVTDAVSWLCAHGGTGACPAP